jgi:hypothetical protein
VDFGQSLVGDLSQPHAEFMPFGHDAIPNFSHEEDFTISGPFPEEAECHKDSYIKHLTAYCRMHSPSIQKIYANLSSIKTDTRVLLHSEKNPIIFQ